MGVRVVSDVNQEENGEAPATREWLILSQMSSELGRSGGHVLNCAPTGRGEMAERGREYGHLHHDDRVKHGIRCSLLHWEMAAMLTARIYLIMC